MRVRRLLLILIAIFTLLSACAPQTATPEAAITTEASPTEITPYPPPVTNIPTTPTQEPPSPVSSESPGQSTIGSVAEKICYPSEFIPAMTVYFSNTTSGVYTELQISENQSDYQIDLGPGRYIAFATQRGGMGGPICEQCPAAYPQNAVTTRPWHSRCGRGKPPAGSISAIGTHPSPSPQTQSQPPLHRPE